MSRRRSKEISVGSTGEILIGEQDTESGLRTGSTEWRHHHKEHDNKGGVKNKTNPRKGSRIPPRGKRK